MKKILILIILILISCKSTKPKIDCDENEQFKQMFFSHIENIDKNMTISQNAKFRESVIFISNYAPTSTNEIMNYARSYPFGIYQQDRKKWIEWYEENKCKNIQLKNSYIIPDAYKE
jgi:hypothetical protein